MPVLFSANTGKVVQLDDKVAAGCLALATVENDNPDNRLSYLLHRTIITRLGVSSAGNFQFLHTIGNAVYIYVFGDRIGTIQLHGLSFASDCADVTPGLNESHGFERLYAWYRRNRLAVRQSPIAVTIGRDTTFQGFVTGLTGDVQDPANRTVTFQLTLATLPDRGN